MDNEYQTIRTNWNTLIHNAKLIDSNIDNIREKCQGKKPITEKRMVQSSLIKEISAIQANLLLCHQFRDKICPTIFQNGLEFLHEIESDGTELLKKIKIAIAVHIAVWDFKGLFVKKINSTVYSKFNNLHDRANELKNTINIKSWRKCLQIWTNSLEKIEHRADKTEELIKKHLMVLNINRIPAASKIARELIENSVQQCLVIVHFCTVKIEKILGKCYQKSAEKVYKNEKYSKNESHKKNSNFDFEPMIVMVIFVCFKSEAYVESECVTMHIEANRKSRKKKKKVSKF